MRIHCLSSITLEIGDIRGMAEDEIKKKINDAELYALTIIEIGYTDVGHKNEEGKWCIEPFYKFLFIRDASFDREDLHDVKLMTPGSMKITNIDWKNFIIDIEFIKSRIEEPFLRVKSIRIRNIKQISTSTNVGKEREYYREYLKNVNIYQLANPGCTIEKVFDIVKMKSSVVEKTVKQTMRCIRDAIKHLCNTENGSYKNIPTNARYKTKLYSIQEVMKEVIIQTQKEYARKKVDYKCNWHALVFKSIFMPRFDAEWFEASSLLQLHLIKVQISDKSQEAWKAFADGISQLNSLLEIRFEDSELTEIPSYFFQKLPKTLKWLYLSKNNLSSIPPEICHLTTLFTLVLSHNSFLTDAGIPWKYLPESIRKLDLSYTGVTEVPKTIERLKSLTELSLIGIKICNLAWNNFPKEIDILKIDNVNDIDEINELNLSQLSNLEICNTNQKEIKIDQFPARISTLNIQNSQLESITFHSDYTLLYRLNLANNNLKYFPWKDIPRHLMILDLSRNQIEQIDPISSWKNLEELNLSFNYIASFECPKENVLNNIMLELNLSNNQLSSLPYNFENFAQIKMLNLSSNNFKHPNLSEKLWERLPKKVLENLRIDNNDIHFLPCMLRKIPLLAIGAKNCNLKYICPQLSKKNFLNLDLRNNPSLKSLSFIPRAVLPLPDEDAKCREVEKDWDPENENYSLRNVVIVSNNLCRSTDRSRTFQKRLFFDFKECSNSNDTNFCKCCAKCGELTENILVEQLMTTDINLFEENFNKKFDFWEPGTWKTNVKTRLCNECKEMYQKGAQNIVISNKRKRIKKDNHMKRQKNDKDKSDDEMEGINKSNFDDNSIQENYQLVFNLSKLNAIDSFLIAILNAIDSMKELKESLCKSANVLEQKKVQKELSKILQRNHFKSIILFRKSVSEIAKNRLNKNGFVFEKIFQSFDNILQLMVTFSYDTVETCLCSTSINHQMENCIILKLIIDQKDLNQNIITFDSILQKWKNCTSSSYYCQICKNEKLIEKHVLFGNLQEYLIIELDIKENESSNFKTIFENFNINNQLIFGSLWNLECVIQQINVGCEGRYLTWKKCISGWSVCNHDQHWHEKQLPINDFKKFKIMIFKKLVVQFLSEDVMAEELDNREKMVENQNLPILPPISTLLKRTK